MTKDFSNVLGMVAYFEQSSRYNLANLLLNELKSHFDSAKSADSAIEDFKNLYKASKAVKSLRIDALLIWISLRWKIKFEGLDLNKFLQILQQEGLHQTRRNIVAQLARNNLSDEIIDNLLSMLSREFDKPNLFRLMEIIEEKLKKNHELELYTRVLRFFFSAKYSEIIEILNVNKNLKEKIMTEQTHIFLFSYYKTAQSETGIREIISFLKTKDSLEHMYIAKLLFTYTSATIQKKENAIEIINLLNDSCPGLSKQPAFLKEKVISLIYYRDFASISKIRESSKSRQDFFLDDYLDEFINLCSTFRIEDIVITPISSDSNRILEFHGLVFGNTRYVEDLINVGFKSLTSASDFQEITKQFTVRFYIDTTEELKKVIQDNLKQLRNDNYEIIISDSTLKKNSEALARRGQAYFEAIKRCVEEKAVYVMFPPDMTYGNGFLNLIKNCPEGGGAGGGHIRHSDIKFRKFLKDPAFGELLRSEERNRQLATLALTEWRIDFHRYYFENILPSIKFSVENSVLSLNQPFGVMLVAKPDAAFLVNILKTWNPRYGGKIWDTIPQVFDHNLPIFLAKRGLYYGARSSDEWICCEPTNDTGYIPQLKALPPLSELAQLESSEFEKLTTRPYELRIKNSIFPASELLT
ncbi:MAG: hypothetical protein CBC42_05340 [Betaproteobacteria bacterium TMED82]|nr:MAG: hypothetical protein CBC42_05340 [Betaproteobacteria bacterium TMED82]